MADDAMARNAPVQVSGPFQITQSRFGILLADWQDDDHWLGTPPLVARFLSLERNPLGHRHIGWLLFGSGTAGVSMA